MRFTCDARDLCDAVTIAATVVPSRSSKPVLMNLALVSREGGLEVLATDLEVGLRFNVTRVDIEAEGAMLVNAGRMAQILKELGEQRVSITANDNSGCHIEAEGCRFHVYGEDFAEYPTLSRFAESQGPIVTLPADALREMVAKTQFAAAVEKTRYAMNGIMCQINAGEFRLVATDGKRLAMITRPLSGQGEGSKQVVVPTKAMSMVSRLLLAGEDSLELRFEESQVLIKSACAEISARLVEGNYPPYEQVIPSQLGKVLTIDSHAFSSALRKASLLTTRESSSVRFSFQEGGLQLSARVADVGASEVELAIDYDAEPVSIGFNPQFLLDALKVMEPGAFEFKFNDPSGAAVMQERGDGGLLYVVMPINLGSE